MKQLGEAAERALRHRAWHWCRRPNGFCDQPRWRLVADRCALPLYQVIAFVNRLEEIANASEQRGHVGHFSAAEFGAALGMPEEDAARIFAALEDPSIGWIAYDVVHDFTGRNPDQLDNTTAERQRRRRARLDILKATASLAREGKITLDRRNEIEARLKLLDDVALFRLASELQRDLSTCHGSHGVTRHGVTSVTQEDQSNQRPSELSTGHGRHGVTSRDSVTVTAEQSTTVKALLVDNSGDGARGESGGPAEEEDQGESDPQAIARAWLTDAGLKLVADRLGENVGQAHSKITRWLDQMIEGDASALEQIIRAADATDYVGPRFHNLVVDGIQRARRRTRPELPLVQVISGSVRSRRA